MGFTNPLLTGMILQVMTLVGVRMLPVCKFHAPQEGSPLISVALHGVSGSATTVSIAFRGSALQRAPKIGTGMSMEVIVTS